LAAPELRQPSLGPANAPIGGEVSAILGAIGESHHDNLTLLPRIQNLAVDGRLQKSPDDGFGAFQVVDRFEQRYDIQTASGWRKSRHARQDQYHQGILGATGVADNQAMEAELAIALLNARHQAKNLQRVLGKWR
jgi:hypothetical protein